MAHLINNRWAILLMTPLLISFACKTLSGGPTATSYPEEVIIPEEVIVQNEIVFGPGSFVYTDTEAGLSDLSSYNATLTLAFDGTRDGSPEKWSKTYVMLTTKDPQARQWNIESTEDLSNLDPVFMAEMKGLDYEKRGQDACNAILIQEGDSLGERLEPASFLTGVIGAEEAGNETINDVEANDYTFDQRALGEDGLTESTGELWVAAEGGYLFKYLVTTKAKADYFGEGIEGTLTMDYELTDANKEITITLPEDCPPGMVDAPQLADASNVASSPGILTYDTSSSMADAAAFYQKGLEELGWEPLQDPAVSESETILNYAQGDQAMTIIISSAEGKTTVAIILARSAQQ